MKFGVCVSARYYMLISDAEFMSVFEPFVRKAHLGGLLTAEVQNRQIIDWNRLCEKHFKEPIRVIQVMKKDNQGTNSREGKYNSVDRLLLSPSH